jgi:hypothetical protein
LVKIPIGKHPNLFCLVLSSNGRISFISHPQPRLIMQVTALSTLNCVDAHFGDADPDGAGQQDAQEQDSATGNGGGATSASTLKERLPDSAVPACIVLQLQGKPQQQTATAAAHGQPVDAFGKVGRGRRDAGAQCADASTEASPAVSNAGGAASGAGATNKPDAANQAASSASVTAINGNDHDVDYRWSARDGRRPGGLCQDTTRHVGAEPQKDISG